MQSEYLAVATQIANRFSQLAEVEAVAIAGSQVTGVAEKSSDIDLYIYPTSSISPKTRLAIAGEFSDHAELNDFWGAGNEWDDRETGIHIDAVFFNTTWIEDQLDRVLVKHEASLGYTTCFWYTVKNSHVLFDHQGWFTALQAKANLPYPDELVKAIIAQNHPVLREISSSYLRQIEKAVSRGDVVSLNHRVAALLASYFDIVFAVNKVLHPGEKRLIEFVEALCAKRPAHLREDVTTLLRLNDQSDRYAVTAAVGMMLDHLDDLLSSNGFIQMV